MTDAAKLLFTAKDTWKSLAVRLLTGGRWSHVDLVDPEDENYVIGLTGKKGVHRIKMSTRLPAGSTGAIVTVPTLSATKLRDQIIPYIGTKYDWPGLLRFVLPWHDEDPNRFFCSELIAMGILAIRPDFPVLRKLIACEATPVDIWRGCGSELLTKHICYIQGKSDDL